MTDQRPVSTSTRFSKVFDNIMHNKLSNNIHINNILVPEQFGFQKGISNEIATFIPKKRLFKSINQIINDGGIFCVLAEAVDSVCHRILLIKLPYYGIQGLAEN
jgi:hypothetical protein